jgi:cyclopropane fatty-acyl-phospholipid synthase-like methyltransferase
MDVDPDVRTEAGSIIRKCEIALPHFRRGDALSAEDYPPGPFDLVVSTGLGEFLQRDELLTFYSHVHRVLRTGGVFFTSATARDRSSDLLLPMVELVTQYRSADDVRRILQRLPWREVRLTRESNGLQTFVVATK